MSDLIPIQDLTEITETEDNDLLVVQRETDTTDTTKKIKSQNLVSKTVTEIVLAEAVSGITVVSLNLSGLGELADITDSSKILLAGINIEDGLSTETIKCQKIGEFVSSAHGFTLGVQYYLGSSGNPVTKNNIPGNVKSIPLFVPRTANILDLNVGQIESITEGISEFLIGDYLFSPIKKDHPVFLEWTFDEFLKTEYQELWNEIGDIFEADHVAVGQSLTSSDYFYPTPVPGSYTRTAFPDIEFDNTDVVSNKINVALVSGAFRNGNYFRYVKLTGTDITNLTDENYYYFSYDGTDLEAYASEANAISGTSPIAIASAGAGTFKLTQQGIKIDDAFQGHHHDLHGTVDVDVSSPTTTVLDFDGTGEETLVSATDGINGVPRVSNETRPSSTITFGYIKAISIDISSGQPVSAIKFKTGWINNTDWTDFAANILHSLNEDISDLVFDLRLSADGTEANAFKVENIVYTSTDNDLSYGFQINAVDSDNVELQTGKDGARYLDSVGASVVLDSSTSFYYNLIIRKEAFTTQIYTPKYFYKDLTSGSLIHALPDASNYIGDITIEWENGTITNNLSFTTVSGQTINGDLASVWVGEGNGIIILTSDLSDWRVKTYNDNGSNSNGNWYKTLRGNKKYLECDYLDSTVYTITILAGANLFQESAVSRNYTFAHAFKTGTIPKVSDEHIDVLRLTWQVPRANNLSSNTQYGFNLVTQLVTGQGSYGYRAVGEWD